MTSNHNEAADRGSPSMAGELVTRTFEYDGGRQVTTYVPPGRPEAVAYGGDGQLIAGWGAELEAAGAPPTMIVGVHRTDAEDEMVRIREYSPGFAPQQFAAHERFFVEEVRDWVGSEFGVALPAARTLVIGVSAGAELALALGLRHPGIYGAVFAASPGGGYRPPASLPEALPRTYLTSGADVVLSEQAGDHGDPFWRTEFMKMVRWAVG